MSPRALTDYVAAELALAANPEKAAPMAAYMKTDMPFYGVQKPGRVAILDETLCRFPVTTRAAYQESVLALWERAHREEKYLAIGFARAYPEYVTLSSVPLYRRLIGEGAWWDFVDEVAIRLIGAVLERQRDELTPKVRSWIGHRDLWMRRTAIICQVGDEDDTDVGLLFDACRARMHETEFFIRKAIGWALRDYAGTDPDAVREFALANRAEMSGLSFREATKHLEV
jgi:3-methyladenine DNA glycosylase AlkD